jgi:transcriptional antiterminator NusG
MAEAEGGRVEEGGEAQRAEAGEPAGGAQAQAEQAAVKLPPSRFFLVSVVGGMEVKVAAVIMERAKALGLDIRSIVVPPTVKGYVIIEAGDPGDVYEAVRRVRHVKKAKLAVMDVSDVMKLVKPAKEELKIEEGQIVEIVSGPFRGFKAKVVSVNERRKEVIVVLQDSTGFAGGSMNVTLSLDDVRPVKPEEAK